MTTVQPPRTRARRGTGDGALDEVTIVRRVPDWVRRQQRQERRLRRTVALALVLLVAGAVLARWREDPGTIVAAGTARMSAALTSADQNRASPSDSGVETGDASAGGPRTDPVAPGTAPGIPESSATAHADTEEPPASEPTSATSQQPVPDAGAGTISAVDIPSGPVKSTGRTVAYGIDIEDGLPVSAADFAAVVHTVLVDDRGWQAKDDMRFVPVSPAERTGGARVDILVTLASPTLTAKLCAPLNTSVQQVSCWNGSRAVLNLTRWMRGASTYGDDLAAYRDYLVSHEVGHGLGHGHVHCPGAGRPAPVMVQQTKDLEGCTAWPWPTDP
jgi:Protein of unknown function (DUF3152)